MVKSKKTPTKTIVKKTKPVEVKPAAVKTPDKLAEAKEIIQYLLAKLPNETGKGMDRAKAFIA
jgi:hypothetical protein